MFRNEVAIPVLPSDIVIGIDPGLKGGIAYCSIDCQAYAAMPLPLFNTYGKKELYCSELHDILTKIEEQTVRFCILEDVHAMPKQGVTSMFNFGKFFGMIRGVLSAYSFSTALVIPQTWKKILTTTHDKVAAISFCRDHFPDVNLIPPRCRTPHDGMADALCIAYYGTKLLKGEIAWPRSKPLSKKKSKNSGRVHKDNSKLVTRAKSMHTPGKHSATKSKNDHANEI